MQFEAEWRAVPEELACCSTGIYISQQLTLLIRFNALLLILLNLALLINAQSPYNSQKSRYQNNDNTQCNKFFN